MVEVVGYHAVYEEIQRLNKRYLLLGNGFSIALRPEIFSYSSLFSHSELNNHPRLAGVFEALQTEDFELVIRILVDSSRLLRSYAPYAHDLIAELDNDSELLKTILANTIASRHPDRPTDVRSEQYRSCREFLYPFDHIYTFNYDVILYWTLMQDEVDELDILPDDGFRHPEGNVGKSYVSWQSSHSATVHYLHGALHLFDTEQELVKFTWSKTNIPIIEQIREALNENRYPLFVAEGTSDSKMNRIMHNAYLHKSLRSIESCAKTASAAFVVYGHSLAENDAHVLDLIAKGNTPNLYVSIYGDINSANNQVLINNAERLIAHRMDYNSRKPLKIIYFDAESAHVWG